MGLAKLDQGAQVRNKYRSTDVLFNMFANATGLPIKKASASVAASCARQVKLTLFLEQPIRSINTFDKRQDANLDHRAAQYRWERGSENVVEQEIVFECWRFRVKVESATRDQNIQPLSFPGLIIPSNALTVKGLHEE